MKTIPVEDVQPGDVVELGARLWVWVQTAESEVDDEFGAGIVLSGRWHNGFGHSTKPPGGVLVELGSSVPVMSAWERRQFVWLHRLYMRCYFNGLRRMGLWLQFRAMDLQARASRIRELARIGVGAIQAERVRAAFERGQDREIGADEYGRTVLAPVRGLPSWFTTAMAGVRFMTLLSCELACPRGPWGFQTLARTWAPIDWGSLIDAHPEFLFVDREWLVQTSDMDWATVRAGYDYVIADGGAASLDVKLSVAPDGRISVWPLRLLVWSVRDLVTIDHLDQIINEDRRDRDVTYRPMYEADGAWRWDLAVNLPDHHRSPFAAAEIGDLR